MKPRYAADAIEVVSLFCELDSQSHGLFAVTKRTIASHRLYIRFLDHREPGPGKVRSRATM